ncbi:hypothetical protein BC826DRAFT_1092819 [Russula brevipes]|nr:hypothetical protein BC826DRAFT_1092819 [Russula brevipes]
MSQHCAFCGETCPTYRGLSKHIKLKHRKILSAKEKRTWLNSFTVVTHPDLNDATPSNPWNPFPDRLAFEFADYHFTELQSSEAQINRALDHWLASTLLAGGDAGNIPWRNAREMYATIDSIKEGPAPWTTVKFRYTGPLPAGKPPKWMLETYSLCFRDPHIVLLNQIASPDFQDHFNYAPYMQFNAKRDRVWSNLMSGSWAWEEASDIIRDNPSARGSMLVPIIAGSDKTTVSAGTGHQEFHPVYAGAGNIDNTMRRSHPLGMEPVALLPIPKTSRKHRKRADFQTFSRRLYHSSLTRIFSSLKPSMTMPEVARCPDGHFRHVIFSLGPYIADYQEQVWLAAIVQYWCPVCEATPDNLDDLHANQRSYKKTEFLIRKFDPGIIWDNYGVRDDVVPFMSHFPRADIHRLLAPDLLHQLIQGVFKDHLVPWVEEYLITTHGKARALHYIQEIDRRVSAVPAFPGLQRFPDGRDFSQWTGDDSKALMKVYLAAIKGLVPEEMVGCIAAFIECCYIARRNAITSSNLEEFEQHQKQFQDLKSIFIETGARSSISLPRQHALLHYISKIELFASPNGICSSITERKHITAVKEPWRRSSHFNALPQMVTTISRLDKLSALRRVFRNRGMLEGTPSQYALAVVTGTLPPVLPYGTPNVDENISDDGDCDGDDSGGPLPGPKTLAQVTLALTPERSYPNTLDALAAFIKQPGFPTALRQFVYARRHPAYEDFPLCLPEFSSRITIFHSAVASFYAPSDLCGAGGMYHERIRANPRWKGGHRFDTETQVLGGMLVARVLLFFSFYDPKLHEEFPCALVNWFLPETEAPDPSTGMWVLKPEVLGGKRSLEVIHLDTIVRGAHLLPQYGSGFLPEDFGHVDALDAFKLYFLNHFVDYHAHELICSA